MVMPEHFFKYSSLNSTKSIPKENFTVGYSLVISDSLSALQSITNSPIRADSFPVSPDNQTS